MKLNLLLKAAAVFCVMLTLSACTSAARQAQIDAGARVGAASAGVTLERQPDECQWAWPDISAKPGDEAQSLLRRYIEYVRGPINGRIARCWQFNENQRIGLERGS